jgi:phage tail sheath protein FI
MVQVSFPGVYIREVPSGARTITGVATAIAAFVGMTRGGPLRKPTTILGFTDYSRIFTADTSQGGMTDQVRQFFLNGGQQAIIMRIADDAAQGSSVTLSNGTVNVLTLTSANAGTDENNLRATVDYNTPDPERTFNLTIFREVLDSSGNASVSQQELIKNLSFDPADPRFVVTTIAQESQLATANVESTAPGAAAGVSISGMLGVTFASAVGAGSGSFRITVGARSGIATVHSGGTDQAGVLAAIRSALSLKVTDPDPVTVTFGTNFVRIAATGTDDVRIAPSGQPDDITLTMGLGVAQGGVEFGAFSAARPQPSGLVSVLGATAGSVDSLLAFAAVPKTPDWVGPAAVDLKLSGSVTFTVPAGTVKFPVTTGTMAAGNAVTPAADSLRNVRQNLQAIADAINIKTSKWRAAVHGYRLALLPAFGDSQSGPGHQFTAPQPSGIVGANGIFDTVTGRALGAKFAGGDNGGSPKGDKYDEAYNIIDSQVDLFNILVLPRTTGIDSRSDLWGNASAFCERRRAFLLIDAADTVDNVTAALEEVKRLRIGIVKDHSALYWPQIQVKPDASPSRFIDPSGTIAGIMARIDANRGVWKAPAGLEADLRGVLGVKVPMSDPENGLLNPEALNAIRVFPNGIVTWGARTMDGFDNSGDDDFKYVPVRRFELFIEESLVRGLKFAVFEPNAEPLWAQIRLAVGAFMNNLFRQGAFAATNARDAFFVKVDEETTTQNDINLGIVNVVVGFAPLKPAEFVVITIKQQAGQIQV